LSSPFEHVIVLMLENRSLDHLLGYLYRDVPGHPFEGLRGGESNPDPNGANVPADDSAVPAATADANHTHEGVIEQLCGHRIAHPRAPYTLWMNGFVRANSPQPGRDVMRCFAPANAPRLSELARSFAVCDHWFCSVPGETWPNRQFAIAGTSAGTVDITVGFYTDDTIFEKLEDAGKSWRIYHQGPAQAWAYPRLWLQLGDHFGSHAELWAAIRNDRLPTYSFVEPDHGLVLNGLRETSNSMHPTNNVGDGRDFAAAEALVWRLYTELFHAPEVFGKTLLVVTFDEHGGYFDHVPPPQDGGPAVAPDGRRAPNGFAFDLLGPRVPTLFVSPWIRRGAVDQTVYDHSAIPATLRALFAPGSAALGARAAVSETFPHPSCIAQQRRSDLLDPGRLPAPAELFVAPASEPQDPDAPPRPLDDFRRSLVELCELVDDELNAQESARGAPEALAAARTRAAARPRPVFRTEVQRSEFLRSVDARIRAR
jgi:phospholipase C